MIEVVLMESGHAIRVTPVLARYGMVATELPMHAPIPGSYWGDSEAGLVGSTLYYRCDTPLHSVLHEASHFVCMDERRRRGLNRDAGGDHAEENAVCYLQVLLADQVAGFGRERMFEDMDAWGYTFRLGSARAWFHADARDAHDWLLARGIIDATQSVTWKCG